MLYYVYCHLDTYLTSKLESFIADNLSSLQRDLTRPEINLLETKLIPLKLLTEQNR